LRFEIIRYSWRVNFYALGLAATLAATSALGQSNAAPRAASQPSGVVNTNDPAEIEYRKILADDDTAQEEIQQWISEADAAREKGSNTPATPLRNRLRQRMEPVDKEYKDFIARHPGDARIRLAYGSLLTDMGDEDGAVEQWEKARELEPSNPAAWHNLATIYGEHRGPITKAFEYWDKAISLKPDEPLYYQSLADEVYCFRMDATNYYHITETEVFDKALGLYRQAMKLDPGNFVRCTEYAQSFYGIKPPRPDEALQAWEQALKLAHTELEREGVCNHLARIKLSMGRLEEARRHLDAVTNENFSSILRTLNRNLSNAVAKASSPTNAPGR